MPNGTPFLGRAGWLNLAILAVILLVVFPLCSTRSGSIWSASISPMPSSPSAS